MIQRAMLSGALLVVAVIGAVAWQWALISVLFAFVAGLGAMTVMVDWSEGKRP